MSIWNPVPLTPRECANPKCRRTFRPSVGNHIYCCDACITSAYRQRRRLRALARATTPDFGHSTRPSFTPTPEERSAPSLTQAIHDAFVTTTMATRAGPTLAESEAALLRIIGEKEFVEYPDDVVAPKKEDL